MKRFFIFLTLCLGMCLVFSFAVYQEVSKAGSKPSLVPDEIIVKFNRSVTNTGIRNILDSTALDLGTPGMGSYYGYDGYSRMDARAAAQVAPGLQPCFYVSDISLSILKKGRRYFAQATITIMDSNYFPVPDATVYVTWSGVVSGTDSGVTGPYGTVTFTSPSSKSAGPFYITVDYVTHPTMPPCYI